MIFVDILNKLNGYKNIDKKFLTKLLSLLLVILGNYYIAIISI